MEQPRDMMALILSTVDLDTARVAQTANARAVAQLVTGPASDTDGPAKPAETPTESAPDDETPPKTSGSTAVADRALANVRVMWTRISGTPVCLRIHGESSEYVLAGLYDAAWLPGAPAIVSLWAVGPEYAGSLPRVGAWQVFGGEMALGAAA